MITNACKSASLASERRPFLMTLNPRSSAPSRFTGGEEPRLEDLIADPMTRRLMESDGVRMDRLLQVIADARSRLR